MSLRSGSPWTRTSRPSCSCSADRRGRSRRGRSGRSRRRSSSPAPWRWRAARISGVWGNEPMVVVGSGGSGIASCWRTRRTAKEERRRGVGRGQRPDPPADGGRDRVRRGPAASRRRRRWPAARRRRPRDLRSDRGSRWPPRRASARRRPASPGAPRAGRSRATGRGARAGGSRRGPPRGGRPGARGPGSAGRGSGGGRCARRCGRRPHRPRARRRRPGGRETSASWSGMADQVDVEPGHRAGRRPAPGCRRDR